MIMVLNSIDFYIYDYDIWINFLSLSLNHNDKLIIKWLKLTKKFAKEHPEILSPRLIRVAWQLSCRKMNNFQNECNVI